MSHIQMIFCYVIVTLILKFFIKKKLIFKKIFSFDFLGKTFPKIHHRTERPRVSLSTSDDDTNTDPMDEDTSSANNDYVFRILFFYPDR
jgi:hypothetical protein